MIISDLREAIGNTPLLKIPLRNGEVELYLKLEMFNPTGSMKDRMALSMLEHLISSKSIDEESTIVESSSGNTASALAMLCASYNLSFMALMDNHASEDKIRTVRALGAQVEIVSGKDESLSTAIRDKKAFQLASENDNTYWTAQHDNPANAEGYKSLALELVNDLGTNISYLISAIGTGGSLCGTARELRNQVSSIKIIGVEPQGSIIFGGRGHEYHQSGTGTPSGADVGLAIDYDYIDEGRKVSDSNAFSMCHFIAKKYGLLVGGSTGGSLYEAINYSRGALVGDTIVVLACDSGAKYLDTIYSDNWLAEKGIELTNISEEFADIVGSS
jgi:cystathionine beta-synthase